MPTRVFAIDGSVATKAVPDYALALGPVRENSGALLRVGIKAMAKFRVCNFPLPNCFQ